MHKIASKENNIADFISRVYVKNDIDKYFESCIEQTYKIITQIFIQIAKMKIGTSF